MIRSAFILLLCSFIHPGLFAGTGAASTASKKKTSRKSTWKSPTYADSTLGDNVDGEDLDVRRAAVQALGRYNGSVVATDANTGRIFTIVNQQLAFRSGFQPCSIVKLVTALASLNEKITDRTAPYRISRKTTLDLTGALAHSNLSNGYFGNLGAKLGFERVLHYAQLLGLGEKAGLDIPGELPGTLPAAPPKDGVAMMTSFGEGISLTPLELSALLAAIANGGTLYYLQYPRTQQAAEHLVPRVKRKLEIGDSISDVKYGMRASVEYGTGRKAGYDPSQPLLGKTGTCTDYHSLGPTHMGWFGSFNDFGRSKLVIVVMLTGGRSVNGPLAAGVAGGVYKQLEQQSYFDRSHPISPAALVSVQSCCRR
jgi:cell division protein FtsI/penicillin-binding protein 2